MTDVIQKILFALGGLARWIYAMFMNIVFDKNHQKNIGYYLFEDEEVNDNSGMDSKKKNFVLGIFMFILIITLIQFIEN
ncbi:hypothetical protein [Flavobacterium sp.]|uniref:hypothetical protein n=1 Tax=Flavobacterium sp. TaxID=239 RepID=UPI002B4B4A17|nr:hypothetical protein [Flavobacterium sp.]HLP65185.1 hypothetical protein [Flavobacterium sp.]